MNWIDLLILVIVVVALVKGFRDGLLRQFLAVISILVATYLCGRLSPYIERLLVDFGGLSLKTSHLVALILAFVAIILCFWVLHRVVQRFLGKGLIAFFNRLAGALLGGLVALLLMSYLFMAADAVLPPRAGPTDVRLRSKYYMEVKCLAPTIVAPHLLDIQKILNQQYNDNHEPK